MNSYQLIGSIKKQVLNNDVVRREAYKEALQEINDYLKANPETMSMGVPAPAIQGLFYYDDRQEVIANMLKNDGFNVKYESKIIDGAVQLPTYYIYF